MSVAEMFGRRIDRQDPRRLGHVAAGKTQHAREALLERAAASSCTSAATTRAPSSMNNRR
jgi:hypothetical protein